MMVKAKHAVVAVVAMGRPHRPENVARLAILQFVRVSVAPDGAVVLCLQVEYFCVVSLQLMVLFVNLLQSLFIVNVFRNYPWVFQPGSKQKNCGQKL
jgi:hypothetical protein